MSGKTILGAALVVSAAVVASFVTSTAVASRAYLKRGEQDVRHSRTLEVTGSAKKRVTSDLALWDIRVRGEGKTLQDAFQRLNAAVEQVRAFLKQHEFPESSVTPGPIDTTIHYQRDPKGNETREAASYQLTRIFSITVPDVKRVAKAAGEVTELLQSGVHVESREPRFVYTKLADMKIAMIGEATANARERAERIATESRCRVGAVKAARGGVFQITPPWSTDVSGSGINDTSTIDKDVSSVVHVTVTIEPLKP